MTKIEHKLTSIQKRALKVHRKVVATAKRPKLLITRSNKFIYLQVIDEHGKILFGQDDAKLLKAKKVKGGLTKTQRAEEVAKVLVQDLQKHKITALAVDRGPYKFHGRIKKVVETLKENGVEV